MSESCTIEIYENEIFSRMKGWVPFIEKPWTLKDSNDPCRPPDEIRLPSKEWCWASNWKINKKTGLTDEDGWEYASRMSRFDVKNRAPKSEAVWSKARRRVWVRVMRREVGIRSTDLTKVLPKIQLGLSSIHSARIRIEEIVRYSPESIESDQMKSLVASVKKNIQDVLILLEDIESKNGGKQSNSTAIIKKLRNDVLKEENAIDKSLFPSSPSSRKTFHVGSLNSNGISSVENSPSGGKKINFKSSPNRKSRKLEEKFSFNSDYRKVPDSTRGKSRDDLDLLNSSSMNKIKSEFQNKSSTVKSGKKGAFNPSIFQGNSVSSSFNPLDDSSIQDGVFLDRSLQDLMIEKKFVPIDEATVMQEIIDERATEINKVHKGIVEINEMFTDLSKIVKEQKIEIDTIYNNVDASHEKTKVAYENILEANRLQQAGSCIVF